MSNFIGLENIEVVLKRFREIDSKPEWTEIDDYMSYLEFLEDDQMAIEADVIFVKHRLGDPRCPTSHSSDECIVPLIMDAVDCILGLYQDYGSLEPDNRYVLAYYLTLTATGDIIS